jgi:hypothetical protein
MFMSENNLAKIAITTSADNQLSQALDRVNQGFEGGRVTKTDFASWLIQKTIGTLDDSGIDEVRRAHFNQVIYLEGLIRKLKAAGRDNLGVEEMAMLQAMVGQQTTKKRSRSAKEPNESEK